MLCHRDIEFSMNTREVEGHPEAPLLSEELTRLLTELCFRPDDSIEPVDLLFVFSSTTGTDLLAKLVEDLLDKGITNKVFITGGIPAFEDAEKIPKPECELVLEKIDKTKYPGVQFYTEDKSTNTLENLTEALKVLDFSSYDRVMFIFKKHDPRRAYLTLRRFLPKTKLIQKTFAPIYTGTDRSLDKDTWHTYDFGISRVWGEYLRIKKYGERGDIAYDEDTRSLVLQIENLIAQK